MTTTKILRISGFAAAACIALAGCASKPDPNSFGGRLALEGGEVAAIGEEWNTAQAQAADGRELVEDGKARIKKGEKQVAKGEDNIEDGKAKIARGERMIANGERKAQEAEIRYRARTAAPAAQPAVY